MILINLDDVMTIYFDIVHNNRWHQDQVTCRTNDIKAIGKQLDSGH